MKDNYSILMVYTQLGTKQSITLSKVRREDSVEDKLEKFKLDIKGHLQGLSGWEVKVFFKSIMNNVKKYLITGLSDTLEEYGTSITTKVALCTVDSSLVEYLSQTVNEFIDTCGLEQDVMARLTQTLIDDVSKQLYSMSSYNLFDKVMHQVNSTLIYNDIQIVVPDLERKVLHITHDDTDAIACALIINTAEGSSNVVHRYLTTNDELRLSEFKNLNNVIDSYDFIYVTDMTLKSEYIPHLQRAILEKKLLWVDHHQSEYTNPTEWYYLGEEHGACAYLLELLYSKLTHCNYLERLKLYVSGCSSWDTWSWVEDETNFGLYVSLMNDSVMNSSLDLITDKVDYDTVLQIVEESISLDNPGSLPVISADSILSHFRGVSTMLSEIQNVVTRWITDCKVRVISDIPCAEVILTELDNVGVSNSLLCHLFLEEISKVKPEVETIYIVNEEKDKLSIRTTSDNIDLYEMCSIVGGGGHKKAAGCSYKKFKSYFIDNDGLSMTGIRNFG